MKKKIRLSITTVLLVALIAVAGLVFNFVNCVTERKTAAQYLPFPITRDTLINDKMQDMRNNIDASPFSEPKTTETITISNVELMPDSEDAAEENSEILNKLLKNAKDGTKITLPKGRYYFGSPINVVKKRNILITAKGEGATFINASYGDVCISAF